MAVAVLGKLCCFCRLRAGPFTRFTALLTSFHELDDFLASDKAELHPSHPSPGPAPSAKLGFPIRLHWAKWTQNPIEDPKIIDLSNLGMHWQKFASQITRNIIKRTKPWTTECACADPDIFLLVWANLLHRPKSVSEHDIPVVPGQAGGGSFQKEKNYIAQKEFAYRMCARRPTSAMPKSFLCCERAFCRSMVVMFCALKWSVLMSWCLLRGQVMRWSRHLMRCNGLCCVMSRDAMRCHGDALYYSSTTLYYKVLLQYYPVPQILLCTTSVLSCTTKYYSSTTLYYSSTTLYYKVLLQY